MNVTIGWAGIGIIFTIFLHGAFSIWWASKITNQIDNLTTTTGLGLSRLDKELEKRDTQIRALWVRVDNHGERLSTIEGQFKAQNGGN